MLLNIEKMSEGYRDLNICTFITKILTPYIFHGCRNFYAVLKKFNDVLNEIKLPSTVQRYWHTVVLIVVVAV